MGKENIEVLITGGKATAAPPLGPALGPMGVNIGQVVADINNKTADFAGMQVPVTVTVDTDSKEYTITVGTPPASALIKQEVGLKKGAQNPGTETAGDIPFDKILKIVRMKEDSLLGKDRKEMAKEILGTCRSMGINIDGKSADEVTAAINKGDFDNQLKK
ncbi:MAG: 50S ribosomal protein L11 [Candidatus Woesearchaeota archaeon]